MKAGPQSSKPGADNIPNSPNPAEFAAGQADLASRWLGGSVLAASDESFGEKENLLTPGAAAFEPGRYSHRGEIVDGWETRRRREPGNDWALVRLGTPGIITSVDVDTSFFTGNFPEFCKVEACGREGYPGPQELFGPENDWIELKPRSPLKGDAHNILAVSDGRRFTHVRLSIFPDGGVARLRVLGQAVPDPRLFDELAIDLASQNHGGMVVASSDGFYSSARLLNRPDQARTMGEGWETRRRRDDGHDFAVIQLALAGEIRQIEVDTAHFKYNASAEVAIYGCPSKPPADVASPSWTPLIPRTRLQPDTRHVFAIVGDRPIASAVRIDAFPDGGISRVRVHGIVEPAARRQAGYRWFNSLPSRQAVQCLVDSGLPAPVAVPIVGQRPLSELWLAEMPRQSSPAGPAASSAREYHQILRGMLEGRLS